MREDSPLNPRCLCQNASLCRVCVKRGLSSVHEHRQQATIEWKTTRRNAQHQQEEAQADFSETAWEIRDLQDRLEKLQRESAERALSVAQRAVELEERQGTLSARQVELNEQRAKLEKLGVLEDSLFQTIASSQQHTRRLRVQWAVQAMQFYQLKVEPPPAGKAKGIGKIGGLPLPHAGLELFGVLPPAELESALRLVASLVHTIAHCLAIPLPHPILLTPVPQQVNDIAYCTHAPTENLEASTSSLVASWMSSATTKETYTTPLQGSLPRRIHHARAAVLAEDDSTNASQYALVCDQTEAFGIAWQLLQNNLV
jgi:hypothetical protein